jgi:4-oxalocrotonate tautomerase
MPHVIVKLYRGRTEEQKAQLTAAIVRDVISVLESKEESVSVAIEDVEPADWAEKVYKPDILQTSGKLFKKPGYQPPV